VEAKMRKTHYFLVVVLALFFLMFFHKRIFSQDAINEYIEICKRFNEYATQLGYISQDLLQTSLATIDHDERATFISDVANITGNQRDALSCVSSSIIWFPMIKNEYKEVFCKIGLHTLQSLKETTELNIQQINVAAAGIKNHAALHLVDKAKDIMRSSQKLCVRSIEILKVLKNHQSMINRKPKHLQ
jgi:hypothetical protein